MTPEAATPRAVAGVADPGGIGVRPGTGVDDPGYNTPEKAPPLR